MDDRDRLLAHADYLSRQGRGSLADALRRIVGEPKKVDRILWNERGKDIDEIVLHDAMVHVEQMDDRCWWIGVYKGDARWAGNFHADSRGRMTFSEQENDGIDWDRDESHDEKEARRSEQPGFVSIRTGDDG